ncbi:transmembrane protein 253 [Chanos chanos]|uniref:Transmembrane protein 253 n=1 Tax=Chanos chanos TaxID=29144 RepID=A0A6J2WNX9_CHACN|nr:uncharacterized protein LOC115826569 [Chanos chanos]
MTQNMFQEGLYHVFFRERPPPRPVAVHTNPTELKEIRLVRWFRTVVNARLLVAGVVQVLGAVSCILSTVSFTCLTHSCSVSMTTPMWSSLFFVATGGVAMEVQRKPNKIKAIILMGLDVLCLLLGVCSLIIFTLSSTLPEIHNAQQRVGVYVMKSSCIIFALQCVLACLFTLFLTWRGLRRYSDPYRQDYNMVLQDPDGNTDPLLETEHFSL